MPFMLKVNLSLPLVRCTIAVEYCAEEKNNLLLLELFLINCFRKKESAEISRFSRFFYVIIIVEAEFVN